MPAKRARGRGGTTELAGESGLGAGGSTCAEAARAAAAMTRTTRADFENAIAVEDAGRSRRREYPREEEKDEYSASGAGRNMNELVREQAGEEGDI